MKWSELKYRQLELVDRATPLVMNIAAIEQHGPHLPVGTDAMIGRHFSDCLDERLGHDILTLPQIAVCCSAHHMEFAGTLTVRHETLLAYLADVLSSALSHGFQTFVFLNSHGGNEAVGRVAVEKLGHLYPHAQVAMLTWWTMARDALRDIQESGFGGVGHACEFETSLMMRIAPELVDTAAIADPDLPQTYCWAQSDMLNAAAGVLYRSMKAQSGGSGTVGRPSFASADKGAKISDAVVDRLAAALRDLAAAR